MSKFFIILSVYLYDILLTCIYKIDPQRYYSALCEMSARRRINGWYLPFWEFLIWLITSEWTESLSSFLCQDVLKVWLLVGRFLLQSAQYLNGQSALVENSSYSCLTWELNDKFFPRDVPWAIITPKHIIAISFSFSLVESNVSWRYLGQLAAEEIFRIYRELFHLDYIASLYLLLDLHTSRSTQRSWDTDCITQEPASLNASVTTCTRKPWLPRLRAYDRCVNH